jgi:hypothetical protein
MDDFMRGMNRYEYRDRWSKLRENILPETAAYFLSQWLPGGRETGSPEFLAARSMWLEKVLTTSADNIGWHASASDLLRPVLNSRRKVMEALNVNVPIDYSEVDFWILSNRTLVDNPLGNQGDGQPWLHWKVGYEWRDCDTFASMADCVKLDSVDDCGNNNDYYIELDVRDDLAGDFSIKIVYLNHDYVSVKQRWIDPSGINISHTAWAAPLGNEPDVITLGLHGYNLSPKWTLNPLGGMNSAEGFRCCGGPLLIGSDDEPCVDLWERSPRV